MDTVLDSLPNISAPVNPIVLDNNPTTHAIPTQQTVEERHPGSGLRRSTRHADKREQTLPPSSQLTQSSNIQSMRGFLREARQSEHISQGATQQQAPFLPQQPASISSETESVVSGSPEKTRKDVPVSGYTQPTLGRIKALQLQTDKAAPRQAGASNIVQCTCGCAQVDMMMVRQTPTDPINTTVANWHRFVVPAAPHYNILTATVFLARTIRASPQNMSATPVFCAESRILSSKNSSSFRYNVGSCTLPSCMES